MGPRPPPPPRAADNAPPPKSTSSCSRLRRRWRRRLTVMLGDSSHTPAMLQLAWVCPPAGGGGLYPNASIQQYPLIPFRNVFLVTEIARRPRKTTTKKNASPNCNCCIDRPERRPHRLPPRLRTDGTTTTMPNTKKWKPMVSNEATRCA